MLKAELKKSDQNCISLVNLFVRDMQIGTHLLATGTKSLNMKENECRKCKQMSHLSH